MGGGKKRISFWVSPSACAGLLPGRVSTHASRKEGHCCLAGSGLGSWQPVFTLA